MTADSELFLFEELADWAQLPAGWTFHEVVDVAVDAQDRVYVFTRGEHPLIIFEQDGSFVDSWGEGLFVRPHGVTIVEEGRRRGSLLRGRRRALDRQVHAGRLR